MKGAKPPAQRVINLDAPPENTNDIWRAAVMLHPQWPILGNNAIAWNKIGTSQPAKRQSVRQILGRVFDAVQIEIGENDAAKSLADAFKLTNGDAGLMVPIAQAVQIVRRSDADWKAGMVDPNNLPAIVIKRELLAATPEQRAAALEQVEPVFRARVETVLAAEDEAVSLLMKDLGSITPAAMVLRNGARFQGPDALALVRGPLTEEAQRRIAAKAEAEAKAKAEAEAAKAAPTISVPQLTEVEQNIVKLELSGDHDSAMIEVLDQNLNGEEPAEIIKELVAKYEAVEAAKAQQAAASETLTEQEAEVLRRLPDEKKARLYAVTEAKICGRTPEDWKKFISDLKAKAARIEAARKAAAPDPAEIARRIEAALADVRPNVRQALASGRQDVADDLVAEALKPLGIKAEEAKEWADEEWGAMIKERAPEIRKALAAGDLQTATVILMELGVYDADTPEKITELLQSVGASEEPAPAVQVAPDAKPARVLKLGLVEIEFGGSEKKDSKAIRRAELEDPMLGYKKLCSIARGYGIPTPQINKKQGDEVAKAKEALVGAILEKEFPSQPAPAPETFAAAPPPTMPEEANQPAATVPTGEGFPGEVEPVPAEAAKAVEAEAPADPEPEPEDGGDAVLISEELAAKLASLPVNARDRALTRLHSTRLHREKSKGAKGGKGE